MAKLRYVGVGILLASFVFLLVLFSIKSGAAENQTVIKIEKQNISHEDVMSEMKNKYWDESINTLIDKKVLGMEAEKLGIKPSKQDLKNMKEKSSFLNQSEFIKLSKDRQEEYLKEIYVIKEMAQRETLSRSRTLSQFLETSDKYSKEFKNSYTVVSFETTNKEKANQAEKLLKQEKYTLDQISKKLDIKKETKRLKMFNPEGIPLEKLKLNDYIRLFYHAGANEEMDHSEHNGHSEGKEIDHLQHSPEEHAAYTAEGHSDEEGTDHSEHTTAGQSEENEMDHSNHGQSSELAKKEVKKQEPIHALVVVTKIDNKNQPSKDDIKKLKDEYLNINFFAERGSVFNYLRNKYKVTYMN